MNIRHDMIERLLDEAINVLHPQMLELEAQHGQKVHSNAEPAVVASLYAQLHARTTLCRSLVAAKNSFPPKLIPSPHCDLIECFVEVAENATDGDDASIQIATNRFAMECIPKLEEWKANWSAERENSKTDSDKSTEPESTEESFDAAVAEASSAEHEKEEEHP